MDEKENIQLSAQHTVTEDTQLSCIDGKQPLNKRYSKNQIVLAIGRNKGIKSAVCRELDCSIYQLNHYLTIHSELRPLIKEAKQELVALAEEKLMLNLNSDNELTRQRAAEFVLNHLGKEEWADSPQIQIAQQINIADKEAAIKNIFGI